MRWAPTGRKLRLAMKFYRRIGLFAYLMGLQNCRWQSGTRPGDRISSGPELAAKTRGMTMEDRRSHLVDITDLRRPTRAATLSHQSDFLAAMAFSPGSRMMATLRSGNTSSLILWRLRGRGRALKICTLSIRDHVVGIKLFMTRAGRGSGCGRRSFPPPCRCSAT